VSDAELVALAVCQAAIGIPSDRQFLGLVERLLPGWFPCLPCQSQYNRRLRRLTPWIASVQLRVAELIAEGQVRLADGTLLSCANYPGCAKRSHFAGHASYGYSRSHSQFISQPIHLGHAAGRDQRPQGGPGMSWLAPRPDRSAKRWSSSPAGTRAACCSATKGSGDASSRHARAHRGQAHHSRAPPAQPTPASRGHQGADQTPDRVAVLEPQRQMRLGDHLAKTPGGLAQRVAQRLLALTVGMFCNLLAGRPPRALVAYDGR
jgi:hypothetical protein